MSLATMVGESAQAYGASRNKMSKPTICSMWLPNVATPIVSQHELQILGDTQLQLSSMVMVPLCRKAYASERDERNVSTEDSLLPGFLMTF